MASAVSQMISTRKVRHNLWAILVAGIANFALEAVWYTIFMDGWLNGIGHTREWLMGPGYNPGLQYGTAVIAACVLAAALSCVTQLTGAPTARHGMLVGALVWAGFVLTTLATEYVFEEKPLSFYAINLGFWLIGMVMMGAIVGAWKKKA